MPLTPKASIDSKWVDRFCEAIVSLEVVPHPVPCADWSEDGCDCGLDAAKSLLWPLVGADKDYGRVEDGHPLQRARNASFAAWKRAKGHADADPKGSE